MEEEVHSFLKEYIEKAEEEKRTRKSIRHGTLLFMALLTSGFGLFMGSTAITGFAIGAEYSGLVFPISIILILASLSILWLDLRRN